MIVYRNCDRRYPFLWEGTNQPPARWHGHGEGPAQYLADTPNGAWAEFLRHEEIVDEADLAGVSRALWAVELEEAPTAQPSLEIAVQMGGTDSYSACQEEAVRLRAEGHSGLVAPSAALNSGAAGGWTVAGGLIPVPSRDGVVVVLYGPRPNLVGWMIVDRGQPPVEALGNVRHL